MHDRTLARLKFNALHKNVTFRNRRMRDVKFWDWVIAIQPWLFNYYYSTRGDSHVLRIRAT